MQDDEERTGIERGKLASMLMILAIKMNEDVYGGTTRQEVESSNSQCIIESNNRHRRV